MMYKYMYIVPTLYLHYIEKNIKKHLLVCFTELSKTVLGIFHFCIVHLTITRSLILKLPSAYVQHAYVFDA